jgi:hypothetical protein
VSLNKWSLLLPAAVVAAVAALVWKEIPALTRYLKIARM